MARPLSVSGHKGCNLIVTLTTFWVIYSLLYKGEIAGRRNPSRFSVNWRSKAMRVTMVGWSGSDSEAASITLDVSHGFQGLSCSAPPFYVLSALFWKEFLVSWSSLAMVYWAIGVSFCMVHCLEMAFLVLRQCSQLLDTVIPTVSFLYLWIPNSSMPVTQNSLKCTEEKNGLQILPLMTFHLRGYLNIV